MKRYYIKRLNVIHTKNFTAVYSMQCNYSLYPLLSQKEKNPLQLGAFPHAINYETHTINIYMLLSSLTSIVICTCRGILALQVFQGPSASQE